MIEIQRIRSTAESLGLVCDFVSRHPPFITYEFGPLVRSIAYQLEMQTHLVGFVDNRLAAYLGWIHTTTDIAEIWMNEGGALTRGTGECDAVAVTIFAVADPKFSMQMIRKAKTFEPGRSVYWKRYFTTGKQPSSRAVRKKS